MAGTLATLPGAAPSLEVEVPEAAEAEPEEVPDWPFLLLGLFFLALQV